MCYNPIQIKQEDGTYIQVPCGKCLECLKQYQNAWSNRMYEEIKAHDGKAVFFTLTYNDETVPKNYLVEGELYRSYSDYNYDNSIIRFVGKKKLKPKVCSLVSGERVKTGVPADKVLTDAGIYDYDIIDFNVKRNNQEKFIQHVQRIYGDYLRLVASSVPAGLLSSDNGFNMEDVDKWFENYGGDLFSFNDVEDVSDAFVEVLNDDDYSDCSETLPETYRNRPVMSFNSVRKEDVIHWLNRGLNKVKRNFNHGFKWFVTSEYGPRTLRPHYHGILFGVTREEAQCMFSDWNRHFGFSKIDNVDLTKGGTSYCAKYCAKGLYEHPLCSRDFFYMHGDGHLTEYHSKHYERCLEIFGVDFPIVDKTFHLVSKGLGLDYVDKMKDYFLNGFTDVNFACEGTPTVVVCKDNADNFTDYINMYDLDPEGYPRLNLEKKRQYIETYRIRRKDNECYERKFSDVMDEFVKKFRYTKVTNDGKTISYAMPQYYRAKILSDGLRASLAAYLREVNDNLYRQKFEELRARYPLGQDADICSVLAKEAKEDLEYRMKRARKSFEKQMNKSVL